ncbi:MAG TPA: GDP-mannose 4,6-dehydratase [Acidimicrobiales bacterium]|nr:GDP-mannose 4,6-dehydratase [Acidimicrobiales bacterium]
MKALVTGADGFVGRHLLEHLRAQGDDVVGVDRECDVTNVDELRAALEYVRPDAIYHLAALTAVGDSWLNAVEYTRVNVLGTKNLLDVANDVVPTSSVLLVSSADVYGVVRPEDLPLVESFRVAPANPYSSSKVEAEHVAHDAVRERGQRVVIARPFNHLGPGQSTNFVVPAIVDRLLEAVDDGTDEIVVGDLSTRRDFSDVRDVVRAYRLLMERGVSGEVYNIASGVDMGLSDIAQRLVTAIAPYVRLVADESLLRPVEVPVSRGSYDKLRKATKWRPTISLDTSLRDVIDDMRHRRAKA